MEQDEKRQMGQDASEISAQAEVKGWLLQCQTQAVKQTVSGDFLLQGHSTAKLKIGPRFYGP